MKNISRRVFIKGLAVAGVAAAASTVLAGCNTNMLPGTDNEGEGEVVPTPSNTYTFKDGDNTLTVSAPKIECFSVNATAGSKDKETVYIYFDVNNKLGADNTLSFEGVASNAGTAYQIVVGAPTITDKDGVTVSGATAATTDTGADNLYTNAAVQIAGNTTKSGYIAYSNVDKKWTNMEIEFDLVKVFKDANGANPAADTIDSFTFKFSK